MKKSSGMEINDEGEIIGEDEISVDTVRGCWETAPKNAEAILHFKEQLSKQQFSDQQEVNWGLIISNLLENLFLPIITLSS